MNTRDYSTIRNVKPDERRSAVGGRSGFESVTASGRRMLAKRSTRGWFQSRIAFTLTELLVVIAIIGILASSVLFAMWGAMEMAKETRTRTQIAKLNELLMTRWNSYRTRSISLNWDLSNLDPNVSQAVQKNPRLVQEMRLNLLRDLMRFEMPDRREDVSDPPVTFAIGPQANLITIQGASRSLPTLAREYRRRATQNNARPFDGWTDDYEDSECLYMIVASIRDLGTNGLDVLREGEIGDLDDDGMPEILDAWGRPIGFLRWPAGFVEHPGDDFTWGTSDDIPQYSDLQKVIVDSVEPNYVAPEVYDPFDPLRVDRRPAVDIPAAQGAGNGKYYFNFSLYPLVFSAGTDGVDGIVRNNRVPSATTSLFNYYRDSPNPHADNDKGRNDPYSVLPGNPGTGRRLGEPFETDGHPGYADNIHNHALGG